MPRIVYFGLISMTKRPDYDAARNGMIERAEAFVRPPKESREEWVALNGFVTELMKSGWTRRDVYHLAVDIMKDPQLTERAGDELYDFLTSLTGDCSPESILRFPGDPEDFDELAGIARSKRWRD